MKSKKYKRLKKVQEKRYEMAKGSIPCKRNLRLKRTQKMKEKK